jgi:hypothetical protein
VNDVSTTQLPEQPSLEQLRKQAKDLRDRSGLRLWEAQLTVARGYGFASWARLKRHVELLTRYSRFPERAAAETSADTFLRLACLSYYDDEPGQWEQARRLLERDPGIAEGNVYVAAAAANAGALRRVLAADPGAASREGGPFRWAPLCYLAYARHDPGISLEATLETARLLLDAEADPNAGYLWHGCPPPFTVLTGVFGEGELGPVRQPRHPHSQALARLLLKAGADPNDGQALYNRMFEPGNDHLELLFEFGLGTEDGGPWRRRLGDALDSPAEMVRVDYLVGHGAPPPDLTPSDAFTAAVLAADRARLERLLAADPGLAGHMRAARPALITWATAVGNAAAVEILAELGFDVNAKGRTDVPSDQPWQTALHHAAGDGNLELAQTLLRLGADPNIRDERFDSTPLGWARHFGQQALIELLEPITD